MRTTVRPFVLALVVLVAACGGQAEMEEPGADAETVLEVDNQANLDMVIYVLREGGARNRLGTATAHTTSRFTIPSRLMFGITALRFQADPIGGRAAPVTQTINVTAGETIVMTIPPF